jgi:hypothetical protein
MVSKTANSSIETPQIDLSKLGVSLPEDTMQQLLEAVTEAIAPTVISSVEHEVRTKLQAEYDARFDAEIQAAVTAAVNTAFEQAVEERVKERVQKLYEEIALARRRMFGRSNESMSGQAGLFDEADALAAQTLVPKAETIAMPVQNLDPVTVTVNKHEYCLVKRI